MLKKFTQKLVKFWLDAIWHPVVSQKTLGGGGCNDDNNGLMVRASSMLLSLHMVAQFPSFQPLSIVCHSGHWQLWNGPTVLGVVETIQRCLKWTALSVAPLTLYQGHMQCCLNNLAWHKFPKVLVGICSPFLFLPLLGLKLPNQGSKPVINIYFLCGILV